MEMYPESGSKFFSRDCRCPRNSASRPDASGTVTEMVLHQSGEEQHAARIDDRIGKEADVDLKRRIAGNLPSPGTEAALRHDIEGLASGQPDYDKMVGPLAAGTRQMLPQIQAKLQAWGPLQSIAFTGVDRNGMDVYLVTFRNARSEWNIAPLTNDGKIAGIFFGEKS